MSGRDRRDRDRDYYARGRDRDRERERERGDRERERGARRRIASDDSEASREREKRRRKGQNMYLQRQQRHRSGAGGEMFWDGFQWIPRIGGGNSQEHNATRKNRRLYVANLPLNIGLTEEILGQQMYQTLRERGLIPPQEPNPVLHVWFARERGGNYGFVEFSTLEVTDRALTLDGMMCMGVSITIRRPADYEGPSFTGTLPTGLLALQNPSLAAATGLQGAPKATSRIVRMHKILEISRDTVNDDYLDVMDDMKDGCSKFGNLQKVLIARAEIRGEGSNLVAEAGDTFLEYDQLAGAAECMSKMYGRKYDNRSVQMSSTDEQAWRNMLPILQEMNRDL